MKKLITAAFVLSSVLFVFFACFLFIKPFYNEVIYFYHYHKGNYTEEQKSAMQETRSGKPVDYSVEQNGKIYTVPLPNGATEYPYGGYLVINYEFWGEYQDKIEHLGDFTLEQMGATFILTSKDNTVRIDVSIQNIARRYELLYLSHQSL